MSNKKKNSYVCSVDNSNLKIIRKKLGLSQSEFAEETLIDKKRISRLENGMTELTRDEAIRIGNFSGDSPADIMFGHIEDVIPEGKSMTKVEEYMNDISKKLDLIIRNKSVLELYNEATKNIDVENYEKYSFDSIEEEIEYRSYKQEQSELHALSETNDFEKIEKAVMTCIDCIRFGKGEYAYIAMELSNSLFRITKDESYLAEKREFAKAYIKHLMNINKISKKEM